MAGSNFKKEKLEERIMNELNSLLRAKLTDPRLKNISITKVTLNQDKSVAQIYWDTFDETKRGDIKKAIEGSAAKLRTLLASSLKVRIVPTLNFHYDSQYVDELAIEKLLSSEAKIGKF